MKLNDRISKFFTELDDAESIDELLPNDTPNAGKKADYLLASRRVVVELKSLEVDPKYKVQEELNKHQHRDEYPVFFGKIPVSKILQHLPDGDQINQKIFYKISRSIEQSFREANRQIKSTKSLLNCENSYGILVLLNENIDVLTPHVMAHRASQLLTETNDNGGLRFPHISCVWYIVENFASSHVKGTIAQPSIIVFGPKVENDPVLSKISDGLQKSYAKFCGVPLIISSINKISDSDFMPISKHTAPPNQARHEVWRREYRGNRFLKRHTDNEVIEYGRTIAKMLGQNFVVGGEKLPKSTIARLMKEWTYFLEEAELRGLNLKSC